VWQSRTVEAFRYAPLGKLGCFASVDPVRAASLRKMRTDRWRAHMRCVVRQALESGSMSFEAIRERLTKIMLVTPEEDMYADVLDYLLGVFESEFGYFGYISQEGDLVSFDDAAHLSGVQRRGEEHRLQA
jgi:hypothetical protein